MLTLRRLTVDEHRAPAVIRRSASWLALAMLAVAACGGGAPERAPWPDDLSAFSSRKPFDYQSRASFVRLINDGDGVVTVTRVELTSARFDDVTWTGEATFDRVWDMAFDLPRGGCGGEVDTAVSLTYSIDDGPSRTSRTPVEDQYDSIRSTLDRDCAEATLREAAELRVGEGRVVDRGRDPVYVLPLAFTPTGTRDDVAFRGVGGTVMFNHVAGSASDTAGTSVPLGRQPVRAQVRLQPSRCDLHVLMEGARGTYFKVYVQAPELGAGGWFYLPLDNHERGQMTEFFSDSCGF
jgi:hypothetical protein